MNPPSATPNPFPSLTRPRPAAQRVPPRPHLQPPTITLTSPGGVEREMRSGRWVDLEKSDAVQAEQSILAQRWTSDAGKQEPKQRKMKVRMSLSGKWICGLVAVLAVVLAGGISVGVYCVNRKMEGADLRHGLFVG